MMEIRETTTRRDPGADENPAAREAPAVELRVVHSPDSSSVNRTIAVDGDGALVVGRGVDRGLCLADERMSRSHLRMVWDPIARACRYADLGSANGTYVNGRQVESGLLSIGDVIRAGDSLLVFEDSGRHALFEERVRRAATSALPILVLGETGAGKELLAREIHRSSGRRGALVPVNCAALPRELASAELFGHARGAFSGAGAARPGLFRAAAGGTLFLDEIGDLPKELQPALLRALQERAVRPIGCDHEIAVDVRWVAATHADLEALVRAREFREDLLARLAHVVLRVPPLRERRGEILDLARSFAPGLRFTAAAAEALLLWHWPRNVRELRALMESLAAVEAGDETVPVAELAQRMPGAVEQVVGRRAGVPSVGPAGRREVLSDLLAKHHGNIAAVARDMRKHRSQVYRWMQAFGLSTPRPRRS